MKKNKLTIDEMLEQEENYEQIEIDSLLKDSYLRYGLSVILDRALPDIRDGLKPVHRRVLFAMHELKNRHNTPYKKSARIVGDVIGKYHPHGDSAVYDTMVRMAQPFSMKACLVDGQGNFGSIDGDSAAAMRYTESRMTKISEEMFSDIEKETVDFVDNYDGSEKMPVVLPTKFPNLLVNGTEGIAVGVASSMPPHNPIEVLKATSYIVNKLKNKEEVILEELMEIMPAPDFPTGGMVHGLSDMKEVWLNGRGKFKIRAKWHIEESDLGNQMIVITEIPYQVNKAVLYEKMCEVTSPNHLKITQVEGVREILDLSSSEEGIQITVELKSGYEPEVVFNSLAKATRLQESYSYNNTVLWNNVPKVVGLLDIFNAFIDFRLEVLQKKYTYLLKYNEAKKYLLEGLIKAVDPDNVDKVINLIKSSKDRAEAIDKLKDLLDIEKEQAEEILEMKLQKLTSTQIEDLKEKMNNLIEEIKFFKEVLSSKEKKYELILSELEEQEDLFLNFKDKETKDYIYTSRYSSYMLEEIDINLASLTKEEECNIILTHDGYIRRSPLDEISSQNRGTRGKRRINLKKGDFIQQSFNSHSHDNLMIFTEKGHTYTLKAYEIPNNDSGRFIQNIIDIDVQKDPILMIQPINLESDGYLVMVTKKGLIKRTNIKEYKGSARKSGLIGINLNENDSVIYASYCEGGEEIVITNSNNMAIRFNIDDVAVKSRRVFGVKSMKLKNGIVIGATLVKSEGNGYIACVTELGLIKISNVNQYRTQNRGGTGIKAFKASDRTGMLFRAVYLPSIEDYDAVVMTKKGISNRVSLDSYRATSRVSSGAKLFSLDKDDKLADVFFVEKEDVEEMNFDKEEVV